MRFNDAVATVTTDREEESLVDVGESQTSNYEEDGDAPTVVINSSMELRQDCEVFRPMISPESPAVNPKQRSLQEAVDAVVIEKEDRPL